MRPQREIMWRIRRIFSNTMLLWFCAEWYRRESLESTERLSRHDYNTEDAVRTYRRVAYMPTWQAKNGNYFKNVLLGRRLNLIAKRRRASPVLPSYALLSPLAIHIFLSPVNSRFCIGFNCFDSANHKWVSIFLSDSNALIYEYICRIFFCNFRIFFPRFYVSRFLRSRYARKHSIFCRL